MKIGFTGTRKGMSIEQKQIISNLLGEFNPSSVEHGDCIGGDADFHNICLNKNYSIIIHPPVISAERAFCKGASIEYDPKPYLTRDRHIVDSTDVLLATPKTFNEELQSGTWFTIRHARKKQKPIIIVWPDGTLTKENFKVEI